MGWIAIGAGAGLVIHGGNVVSYCIQGKVEELGRWVIVVEA